MLRYNELIQLNFSHRQDTEDREPDRRSNHWFHGEAFTDENTTSKYTHL